MLKRALVILALLALPLGTALAQEGPTNDDPSRAQPFGGAASGDLPGIPPTLGVGKFAFYSFEYPGDGSIVTISVDVTPGDPATAPHAGFAVYGPGNTKPYAQGAQTGKHPSHQALFSSTTPGTYLVQVFNYNVKPIHFESTATGLPPQPNAPTPAPTPTGGAPAPTPEPAASPTPLAAGTNTSPDQAIELTGPVDGTLSGATAGKFHYFRFAYPGDDSTVAISLDVEPSDQVTGRSVGFVVYGPTFGREYARGGYNGPNAPTHSTTLQSTEAGTYLVQVYNYTPGTAITYRLEKRP